MMHTVVLSDAMDYLPFLSDGMCDVVFLDPPYTIAAKSDLHRPEGGKYNGVTEDWDREHIDRDDHLDFIEWYLLQAKRLVHEDGTVWVMGTYHSIHDVGSIMLDLGYFILNDIVWIKANPTPQFRGVRFTNSIETIIWARPHGKGSYHFDYHTMKELNAGKQMRADWNFPICRGKERIKDANGNTLHQTQKPLRLLERVVLSSVPEGGVIVDFMAGVGTTGIAAAKHARSSVLVERELRYVDAILRRFVDMGIPVKVVQSGEI